MEKLNIVNMKIDNEIFKSVVSEVACQITTERFGEQTWVCKSSEGVDYFEYTEPAQDFFDNKYDEIEHMLISEFKIQINYE